jgi:hypothetical protein
MRPARRLIDAFLATGYALHDGAAWRVVRTGERSPAIDAVLTARRAWRGVFITGWNPFGRLARATANEQRNRALARILAARGFSALPHRGTSPKGDWFEEGFFVVGLDARAARRLARAFGQLAIVTIARGRKAELNWAFR